MPPLLNAASAKADMSIYDEEDEHYEREGWETISMDGQIVGIRTSTIDEKCQVFDTLVLQRPRRSLWPVSLLELTLPALQFYFHEDVREAACRQDRLVPLLMSCSKSSNTLTPAMVSASLSKLVYWTQIKSDTSFLASLYRAVCDTLRVVGTGALECGVGDALIEGCKVQLQNMAEKRNGHPSPPSLSAGAASPAVDAHEDEDEDEDEDFALEDMEKTLRVLDAQHPLLIAVASVRELSRASGDAWNEDGHGVGRVEE